MTDLAMLAAELRQLASRVRAAGDDVGTAAGQLRHAPAEGLGPPAVDGAAGDLQRSAVRGLDHLRGAAHELDHALTRLARRSDGDGDGGR